MASQASSASRSSKSPVGWVVEMVGSFADERELGRRFDAPAATFRSPVFRFERNR